MTDPVEAAAGGAAGGAAATAAQLAALARDSRAWPFEEARKLIARRDTVGQDKTVIFETGYGPSGLPHIGTFGEVLRTTMVRHAFRVLTEDTVPTRLICFSDDMDGLRKVPDNVPNQDLLRANLDKPLTQVPDPFGKFRSFGEHNNAMLRSFLDAFGFDYEFMSATDCYTSGRFDRALMTVLERYDEVMAVMLPSLREERQATYSPFLPVCPRTGKVLQVPIIERDVASGAIVYKDPETEKLVRVKVTGGACKLQWKADWAMRWYALGVDYEMAGKDLIDSVKLSSRICTILGGLPPDGFNYELFLDENGEKISKSKGNGLTIDEWLRYASPESLALFMYQAPRKAKRLYFDVIPRNVDDYLTFLEKYRAQASGEGSKPEDLLANPVWHIHSGAVPDAGVPISFSMLLNLVSASNSEDRDVLWGFIRRYAPDASPQTHPRLDQLVGYAIHYFHDFVLPAKRYRAPSEVERAALAELSEKLAALPAGTDAETIQNIVYEIGKTHPFDNLRDWFKALYEVLIGQSQGPRFGSFVALYGIDETRALIGRALDGSLRED
ncbi:lysine--tRNA ligase [Microbaculum marinisediminis]|uniref:Lysine--tRNA ligase n=1 Tax=Microbaculum marinisediminis TaxID=2931392 RepID=A0AAW5QUQ8_9HYPH|nr:lysine--tRNA ligase [Microbaculum sp. A6E488]MCT8970707.1 lysine--tRNA ligase [Microbaculum sp. A6E488]